MNKDKIIDVSVCGSFNRMNCGNFRNKNGKINKINLFLSSECTYK